MAKLENTGAFLGSAINDVDPGAITYRDVVKNAQADTAGLLRRQTDDTIGTHINHSGPGRGARLGVPMVCQTLDAGLSLDSGGGKNGGYDGSAFEFHWLVVIPPGETDIVVEVRLASVGAVIDGEWRDLTRGLAPQVRLSSSTNITSQVASELTQFLTGPVVNDDLMGAARFSDCADGLALLTLIIQSTPLGVVGVDILTRVADIIVRPARDGVAKLQPALLSTSPAATIAPGASEALYHQVMDEEAFETPALGYEPAISGWHTSRLNANLCAIEEYASGWPAGNNAAYTQTESALRNPTRDRFRAFTRKTFSDEPIPVIPLVSACLGGIKSGGGYLVNPSSLSSYNTRTAFAPFATSTASSELAQFVSQIPDVPTSPSVLRWAILFGQESAKGFAGVRGSVQITSNTASTPAAPTALTGASYLALLTGTGLAFVRDADPNDCRLRVFGSATHGGHTELDYCILAVAMWVQE